MSEWIYGPLGRWSTVGLAAAIFVAILVRTRRPIRAGAAVLAWLALYEITWQAIDLWHGHHLSGAPLVHWLWMTAALTGWLLAAHLAGVRPDWRLVMLTAALFAGWIVLGGFDYNYSGQAPKPVNLASEAWNVGSKTALGLAYLLGGLRSEALQVADPGAHKRPQRVNRVDVLWRKRLAGIGRRPV